MFLLFLKMSLTDLVILLGSIDGPRLGRLVITYYKMGKSSLAITTEVRRTHKIKEPAPQKVDNIHSVSVRNSAISSLDSRERHVFSFHS